MYSFLLLLIFKIFIIINFNTNGIFLGVKYFLLTFFFFSLGERWLGSGGLTACLSLYLDVWVSVVSSIIIFLFLCPLFLGCFSFLRVDQPLVYPAVQDFSKEVGLKI